MNIGLSILTGVVNLAFHQLEAYLKAHPEMLVSVLDMIKAAWDKALGNLDPHAAKAIADTVVVPAHGDAHDPNNGD